MMDWKKDRIQAAKQGKNPMVLATMKSGFAVIGDTSFYQVIVYSCQTER